VCCADGREQLFDAIMPLLSLNGIKIMIERLGAVYFQDYYPTIQTCVCAESLGDAEEGRDDMCGDSYCMCSGYE
jgi:hypothetical protein